MATTLTILVQENGETKWEQEGVTAPRKGEVLVIQDMDQSVHPAFYMVREVRWWLRKVSEPEMVAQIEVERCEDHYWVSDIKNSTNYEEK